MLTPVIISAGTIPYYRHKDTGRKFLLIHQRSGNFWGFPKGHVEHGESIPEAALRETKEETGIEVTLVTKFQKKISYESTEKKEVFFFLAEAKTLSILIDTKELIAAGWFSYEEARSLISFEDLQSVLDAALHFLDTRAAHNTHEA